MCQLTKRTKKKYGKLPVKEAETVPWDALCIDLIGPYRIEKKNKKKGEDDYKLHCLTMIDPATNWFEIVEIPEKRADIIANKLEQTWLVRYPWPEKIICDRGKEFMAEIKQTLRDDYDINQRFITARNPQANAMLERVHQTIGNMIRTFRIADAEIDAEDPFSGILSAVAFATRATVHTTLDATPSQLVFGRDPIIGTKYLADW